MYKKYRFNTNKSDDSYSWAFALKESSNRSEAVKDRKKDFIVPRALIINPLQLNDPLNYINIRGEIISFCICRHLDSQQMMQIPDYVPGNDFYYAKIVVNNVYMYVPVDLLKKEEYG